MKICIVLCNDAGYKLFSYILEISKGIDVEIDALECKGSDDYGKALAIKDYIRNNPKDVVLFPSTISSRTIAPMLAAMLETGLTADCTSLRILDDGNLLQTRPALGGNVIADILCSNARPQMATVCEDFLPVRELRSLDLCMTTIDALDYSFKPELLAEELLAVSAKNLKEARIIISGGKGIGSKSGFTKLKQLASLIPGSAVGASRAAVAASFAPYECQVGLTGQYVCPEIYLAFGISGAVQHLAGMKNSKKVIAVNPDREANIFNYSDIAVLSSWEDITDELIKLFTS